ncbi:MAG: hypothetical protein AAGB14_09525, partial [Verrucomicrobiota bacterium]
ALVTEGSGAVAILDDLYVNRKLGIAFRKPAGWTFANAREMGEVQAGQILDLEDKELARELVGSSEVPILTLSKERLSAKAERFTPGITIFLDRFDALDVPEVSSDDPEFESDPLRALKVDIDSCGGVLRDFKVDSEPVEERVSDCDAAEYRSNFIFEHVGMQPTVVRMRSLSIAQRPAFYTLRMYDSLDEPDCEFDYTSFVDSIRMI